MIFCPKCGWNNVEDAAFCQKCGVPLMEVKEPTEVRPVGTQFDRSFKGVGPLLKALIGFSIILLVVEVLKAFSNDSTFAGRFGNFLTDNLLLIFLILLLTAYSGYSSRRYKREYSIISPLIAATIITFMLWVVANLMDLLASSHNVDQLEIMSDLLFSILYIIFLLVLLIGYIGVIMRADRPQPPRSVPLSQPGPPFNAEPQPSQAYAQSPRMGRSSRDKVLLGVCGGMAEYFHTDPFLIRVLWVIGILLSFGVFVLAYLILAVVLPKNP
jgi:phage shock protein C